MAYGIGDGFTGLTQGFQPSTEGASLLGGLMAEKNATNTGLAASATQANAYWRSQKYAADKQLEAAQTMAAAQKKNPLTDILGGVLSAGVGAFTGGLGTAAGKKWFK